MYKIMINNMKRNDVGSAGDDSDVDSVVSVSCVGIVGLKTR